MKNLLYTVLVLLLPVARVTAQCNAQFTSEQLPGTLTLHFHSTSTSEHDIVSYQWFFGDGQQGDGSAPYHTYAEPGVYNVCLVITDAVGCVDETCHMVEVAAASGTCEAAFAWEQIPGTLTIHFNNNSESAHDIISNVWNFGDGHMGDGVNPNHTYEEPGVYLVCLTITDNTGCVDDVCHEVVVEAPATCDAAFEWEQFPGSLEVDFFSTSSSEHDIVSYQWIFGDGHTGDGPNPSHTYEEPGGYLVCLIIEDAVGCVSDVCHEVVVEGPAGECEAAFTWEQLPGTQVIHFNNNSSSAHDIVANVWNFGDGHMGDGQNPNHTYEEPGVYLVCLTITDASGCVDDVCHEVVVEAATGECEAAFTWEQLPGTLTFHFHSTSTSGHDIVAYQWIFGDGHQGDGQAPYHTYAEPGVYLVCLIITDASGCVSDVCHEVVVEGPAGECEAAFTWEQVPGTQVIHFNNNSSSAHDIVSNVWSFGDGHMGDGQNPNHTYEEPGVYLVCLTITDASGCVDDVCHEVVVEGATGECEAAFTWEQLPGTLTFHFHSTSTSGHDIVSYQWIFGDGHQGDGQAPYHTYAEPGVYLVCLIITDASGCVSDVCHEVVVEGPAGECEASFTWEQVPGTQVIHFNNNSSSAHDIVSNAWNFGDGHMGDGQNPNHTYEEPGVYLVCLTITDASGCVDDVCHEVVVEGATGECEAAFTWSQTPGGYTIQFNNTSMSNHDIISHVWNFGDGHSGDGQSPSHTYAEPGVYLVCLVITDASGCVSDVCHEVIVVPGEPMGASFGYSIGDDGLYVTFHNQSHGANEQTTWTWDFGDGIGSTEHSPTHRYASAGIYTVCLTMFDPSTFFSSEVCHFVFYHADGTQYGPDFGPVTAKHSSGDQVAFTGNGIELRYVNPADESLHLWLRFDHLSATVGLYDLSGRRVAEQSVRGAGLMELTLPARDLLPGIYALRVTAGDAQAVRMVLVAH
jgi:PKD repeat protein